MMAKMHIMKFKITYRWLQSRTFSYISFLWTYSTRFQIVFQTVRSNLQVWLPISADIFFFWTPLYLRSLETAQKRYISGALNIFLSCPPFSIVVHTIETNSDFQFMLLKIEKWINTPCNCNLLRTVARHFLKKENSSW